jgi:ABC-type phosphate/phosphonate transport system substrate-binding protein
VIESVLKGEADAGTIGATIWQQLQNNGANLKCIWSSPGYSHCIFTALPDLDNKKAENFTSTLMKMDYENPEHRRLLDLEGLKKWVPASRDGYKEIFKAVEKLNYATATTVAAR